MKIKQQLEGTVNPGTIAKSDYRAVKMKECSAVPKNKGGVEMCTNQELQIVTKAVVTSALDVLADKIYKVVLYGSYARGDFTSESDIDIMIILDCTREEVSYYRKQITRLASRIGLEHDIMVSILLRDRESFYNQMDVLPFYGNIAKEGVELYG